MAVGVILRGVEDPEHITEIDGRTRSYFVEEGRQSDLFKPRRIPDTDLYVEDQLFRERLCSDDRAMMSKYGYDRAVLEIFTDDA